MFLVFLTFAVLRGFELYIQDGVKHIFFVGFQNLGDLSL